jgi:hypothetical protein
MSTCLPVYFSAFTLNHFCSIAKSLDTLKWYNAPAFPAKSGADDLPGKSLGVQGAHTRDDRQIRLREQA